MNRQEQRQERIWVVIVDSSRDSSEAGSQLLPDRLPIPVQRIQVRRLKDVLLLCRQGLPVGWIVWRMRSVHVEDRECCIELARAFPDIPVFGLMHAGAAAMEELDGLDNVCLIEPHESATLILKHLVAAEAWLPEQDLPLQPGVVYQPGTRSVRVHDRLVSLTEKEQAVLHYMWSRKGQFVSTEELIAAVWDEYTASDAVRQYIYRLRRKLDSPESSQSIIEHLQGRGYRLAELNETDQRNSEG